MKFKRELINGFIIFLGIGIYFVLLELLGLSDVYLLRLLNIFIVAYGVNRTISGNHDANVHGYLRNFLSAVITSMIGAALSIVALLIYVEVRGGEEFLKALSQSFLIGGGDVGSYSYTISLLLFESTAASLIVSFCLMQYWKDKVEQINKVD